MTKLEEELLKKIIYKSLAKNLIITKEEMNVKDKQSKLGTNSIKYS